MKEKLGAAAVFLLAAAIIPIGASKCTEKQLSKGVSSPDVAESTTEAAEHTDEEKAVALTAALYKDGYSDETIKAIAIIMNTNYSAEPSRFEADDFLYEEEADKTVKAAYDKIVDCVLQVKNTTLRHEGKALYIPYSQSSNGFTYESADYDYLCAVGSVWDCFLSDYSPNEKCVGVSLSGLDYLCKNGESCESALKWYLPGAEAVTSASV